MLASLLHKLGEDAGFLIGGLVQAFGRNYNIGTSKYFVVEGDEYDTAFFDKGPKFLHYQPQIAILTSVEFDHADIYQDLEAIKNLGLPFWLAGSYAEPERVVEAFEAGAAGVQIGTAFAYCYESGLERHLREHVL